ncbi:hypothetical protein C8Q75DRAFT_429125 [Abortiporus biennis]|nr:hypothetical protein C8Q75DRAFT_429125 [Abortiporus biennis]
MRARGYRRKNLTYEALDNSVVSHEACGRLKRAEDENNATSGGTKLKSSRPSKKRKVKIGEGADNIRRRVKCTSITDMPLEILFEIFLQIYPQDLLSLSRTTKDFRALLVSKSAIRFWKASSKLNAKNIPPCYPDMNELAFANLLYSPHCHSCLRPNVQTVLWEVRARYCNNCRSRQLIWKTNLTSLQDLGIASSSSYKYARQYLSQVKEKSCLENSPSGNVYLVDQAEIEELKKRWKDVDFGDKETSKPLFWNRAQYVQKSERVSLEAAYLHCCADIIFLYF